MQISLRTLLVLAAGFICLVGCGSPIPKATPVDADRAGVSLVDLRLGRETYVRKCSGCHALHAPDEFNDDVWVEQVHEMRDDARISDDEVAVILNYLRAMNGS